MTEEDTGRKEPTMHGLQDACIAHLAVKFGTPDEVIRRAKTELLTIYRTQPGIAAHALVKTGETSLLSFSVWQSRDQAENAVHTSDRWVKENAANLVESMQNQIGELGFFLSPGDLASSSTTVPIAGLHATPVRFRPEHLIMMYTSPTTP